MKANERKQDHPLADILVNVLIPTILLTQMSKNEGKVWHLGPNIAMTCALALPLAYGIWHWIKHRKINIFSAVGLLAILLTGIITIFLWSSAEARPHAALLFGIKEEINDAQVDLVWDPVWNQDMITEEGKMKLGMI